MENNVTMQSEGGFIFISHAHKDIRGIRPIRNELEDKGFEPICFYLRCLTDDDEVLDLIKREIDARQWFLLVDSENARKSTWVKTEVDYIKSKDPRKLVTVSLDDPSAIPHFLEKLTNSMRVFFSYSSADEEIMKCIYDACKERDLKVFAGGLDIKSGDDFTEVIPDMIREASRTGCIVAIVSEKALESPWVQAELETALNQRGLVLPVLVDDVEHSDKYEILLSGHQSYALKTPVTDGQVQEIVEMIEGLLISRLHEEEEKKVTPENNAFLKEWLEKRDRLSGRK